MSITLKPLYNILTDNDIYLPFKISHITNPRLQVPFLVPINSSMFLGGCIFTGKLGCMRWL